MESLMVVSTRCWRGVSPVASGGPSGSSVTPDPPVSVALRLPAMALPFRFAWLPSRPVGALLQPADRECHVSRRDGSCSNTCSNGVSTRRRASAGVWLAPPMPLAPQPSAVVTGAARGIGRGIAELLVRRGYAVVATDLDADAVRRTAQEIGAAAGLGHDVREEQGHAEAAAEAARHGELRVWVNNAGVGFDGTLTGVSSAHVHALVDVN